MSRPMYYKNAETGVMSMDRRDMERWVANGTDVEIWYYSDQCNWVMGMVKEGRRNKQE